MFIWQTDRLERQERARGWHIAKGPQLDSHPSCCSKLLADVIRNPHWWKNLIWIWCYMDVTPVLWECALPSNRLHCWFTWMRLCLGPLRKIIALTTQSDGSIIRSKPAAHPLPYSVHLEPSWSLDTVCYKQDSFLFLSGGSDRSSCGRYISHGASWIGCQDLLLAPATAYPPMCGYLLWYYLWIIICSWQSSYFSGLSMWMDKLFGPCTVMLSCYW